MPPTFTARDCINAERSAGQNSCVRIGRKKGWTAIWDDKLATPDAEGQCVQIEQSLVGRYTFTSRGSADLFGMKVALYFDADEFEAFIDGVYNREFDLGRFTAAA